MLIMILIIPVTMIVFGQLFVRKAPKDINGFFGYRTKRSMKNKDTWEFAHKYIGRLWTVGGFIFLPISVIPMLAVFGKNDDVVGTIGGVITGLQMIPLIGAIFPTESALKKNFDEFGRRQC